MIFVFMFLALVFFLMANPESRVVSYSFFEQWAEAEVEDINYFIVAPH
jgi:hypothetical protein